MDSGEDMTRTHAHVLPASYPTRASNWARVIVVVARCLPASLIYTLGHTDSLNRCAGFGLRVPAPCQRARRRRCRRQCQHVTRFGRTVAHIKRTHHKMSPAGATGATIVCASPKCDPATPQTHARTQKQNRATAAAADTHTGCQKNYSNACRPGRAIASKLPFVFFFFFVCAVGLSGYAFHGQHGGGGRCRRRRHAQYNSGDDASTHVARTPDPGAPGPSPAECVHFGEHFVCACACVLAAIATAAAAATAATVRPRRGVDGRELYRANII